MCIKCKTSFKELKPVKSKNKNVSKRLKKLLKKNDLDEVYYLLQKGEGIRDYFDISYEDGRKISYLVPNRLPEHTHLLYDTEYRRRFAYHTTVGKLLNYCSPELNEHRRNLYSITASEVLFRESMKRTISVRVVDEICEHYAVENYSANTGELGNSCMRSEYLQEAVRLYEHIGSDIVQLAVILDENKKVLARALLWHNVKCSKTISMKDCTTHTYLDRVYAVDSLYKSFMYDWAKSKGYLSFVNYHDYMSVDLSKAEIDTTMPAPYFDTFKYLSENCKELNNFDGYYFLESTDGRCIEHVIEEEMYTCEECGNLASEENSRYSDVEGITLCVDCAVWSDYCNSYLSERTAVYSDYHMDYFSDNCDELIYCEYEEDYILVDEVVMLDDETFTARDNAVYDDVTEKWYLRSAYAILISERESEEASA